MSAAPDPRAIRHAHPFDPTYGCDRTALAAIQAPPAPEGFAAFWRATRAAAAAVPLRLVRRDLPSPHDGWRLAEFNCDSLGGFRLGGWLLEPVAPYRAGSVVGHGYGGRESYEPPSAGPEPMARIFPCMPGFNRSSRADLPWEAPKHVVVGIHSPETYLIRFCVAAMWTATRALAEMCPAAAGRMVYDGGSFGGGLGALAAPWEPLWAAVNLAVPTFGHHPWRLKCPCIGSGEAVRQLHEQRPDIAATLAFFDAATAATFARQPAVIQPALFDPAVPPPGQWAVANAWAGAKELNVITSGHHDGPWTPGEWEAGARAWHALLRRTAVA